MRVLAVMLLVAATGCHRPTPAAVATLSLPDLHREFDAARDRPRLLALLSPS